MIENSTEVMINDPDVMKKVISNLKPNNNFRITIEAKTVLGGYGLKEVLEIKTRPEGGKKDYPFCLPVSPHFC